MHPVDRGERSGPAAEQAQQADVIGTIGAGVDSGVTGTAWLAVLMPDESAPLGERTTRVIPQDVKVVVAARDGGRF